MSLPKQISQIVWRGVRGVVDAVLPPLCLSCDTPIREQGLLCANCWGGVSFITPPACALCGFPFEYDAGIEALCGNCSARRPAFDRARAVFRYDDGSRRLLLSFKHGDRTEAAKPFGRWLARAGAELMGDDFIIAPVPLHPKRLHARRYNQAALLAGALADAWKTGQLMPDLLRRSRDTRPQGHLSPGQRRRNVQGAFEVDPRYRKLIAGRRIVLIDDVMTTGATVETISRVLKRAGAGAVDILVLARVLKS